MIRERQYIIYKFKKDSIIINVTLLKVEKLLISFACILPINQLVGYYSKILFTPLEELGYMYTSPYRLVTRGPATSHAASSLKASEIETFCNFVVYHLLREMAKVGETLIEMSVTFLRFI